jgi:hypothetical protein
LTRDRRGFENTFLLHADQPGAKPRLLYWYRTAPGIAMGRAPLDEEAIRTIEEQHPDIDFDWTAILALGEVMIHEEEEPPRAERRRGGAGARGRGRQIEAVEQPAGEAAPVDAEDLEEEELRPDEVDFAEPADAQGPAPPARPTTLGLLEELVGRDIATRLRARYSEICARIHERVHEPATREAWLKRAERLDPDLWLTPEAVLEGVGRADALFQQLHRELAGK